MNRIYHTSRLLSTVSALLVLAGCSVSGVNSVAIEDRSINGSSANKPRSVVTQSEQVEVTALDIRPSFKASDNASDIVNTEVSSQPKAPEIAQAAQKPATVALLNTASYQTNNGRLRAAQSSLERALRISPKDPEVYLSLGEVHRRLGEFVQAEQITLKGIAVAAGQSTKLRKLWTALAKIRSEAGDTVGANKAFQKSESY